MVFVDITETTGDVKRGQRQNIEFTYLESTAEVVDGKNFQILHSYFVGKCELII